MPFWWPRRRRWWATTRFKRRKPRYPKRRRRRRYKRKYRRAPRRRRRRRRKVRRKKPNLIVRQWQPDSIVLCKIKLFGSLVLGAEGTQYQCYTNEKGAWTPPQQPGGGGFGIETYSLSYLYDQYLLKRCIWTKSNEYKDLCRYLRCKFVFFRHPKIDFVVNYARQPPFILEKPTYMNCHPIALLLSQHKRVILSKKTDPKGKNRVTLIIKPPKQMITKWFFTKQFAMYDLLQIQAAACTLNYPKLGCCNENLIISIFYLNPQFYQDTTWAQVAEGPYKPYANIRTDLVYNYKIGTQTGTYTPTYLNETGTPAYYKSISIDEGFFSPRILNTQYITQKTGPTRLGNIPIGAARYNPEIDDGKGNEIYLVSVASGHYQKPTEDNLIFKGLPLWLMFFGLVSFIKKIKTASFLEIHMFIVKSEYILPKHHDTSRPFFPILDINFINGKNPYNSYISTTQRQLWYPNVTHQLETINSIVKCGPFIPKLDNDRDSTWELPFKATFYFKWGGPQMPNQNVTDPKEKSSYIVPDTVQKGLQITNPLKQTAESLLHEWDYRRGLIKTKAFKRMLENLSIESDVYQPTETPKKRQRVENSLHYQEEENQEIKTCLLSLCESSSSEKEEEEKNLLKLIQQQQQQQKQLKLQLLTLIKDLKEKQNALQLQTGVI
nr:MAG: ORF1 [Torque teno midi virus]